MCPQDMRTGGRHKDFLKKMSIEEFEENVKDCAKHGLRVVNLEGSGEPTLIRRLPEYIEIVKKVQKHLCSLMDSVCMDNLWQIVDAGLDFYISFIGYDPAKYDEWMCNRIGATLITL